MIHPDTFLEMVNAEVGLGVRASADIPKGTLLWVRDTLDIVLLEQDLRDLVPSVRAHVERLGYRDSSGRTIVCWDGGKHVNHSCSPTMRGVGHDAMIAIADVLAGEEITCDYAECNLQESLRCLCGATACRQVIGGPVSPDLWAAWQNDIIGATRAARGLTQPLLGACVDLRVAAVLLGRAPVPDLRAVEKKSQGDEKNALA